MSLSEVFLGIIALATLVMAVIQIGAIVAVARFARDAQKTLASVQEDVKPLIAKVSALADEATKTATIATAQAEKIDQLVTDLTRRIDETSTVVQQAVITPAREGLAIIAAIRAGFGRAPRLPGHARQIRAATPKKKIPSSSGERPDEPPPLNSLRSTERSGTRPCEEERFGQAREHRHCDVGVTTPESRRLRFGELESRHLQELRLGAAYRGLESLNVMVVLCESVAVDVLHSEPS